MKSIVALVLCLFLIGCGSDSESVLNDFFSKRTLVILASHDVVLTEKPIALQSTKRMKISGTLSSICFVLKGKIPLQDTNIMDRIFADAIGGARISATLVLATGDRFLLSQPSFSWSDVGVVFKDGELAACAVPPCGTALPIDVTVSKVEVSSAPAFSVKGIYWESKRDPSEPLVPSLAAKVDSRSASNSCPSKP